MILSRYSGDAVPREAMKKPGREVADITMFDPEDHKGNLTCKTEQQGLPTNGILYLIVNGKVVVKDSEFQSDEF